MMTGKRQLLTGLTKTHHQPTNQTHETYFNVNLFNLFQGGGFSKKPHRIAEQTNEAFLL